MKIAVSTGKIFSWIALFTNLATAQVPRPNHVLIVVEENTSYNKIIGSPSAQYLNSLAQQGVLFTESFALRHPSYPNYLALFSGSMQGVTGDTCPHIFSGANLGSELIDAGFTFAGYSESMPSIGFEGCSSGPYTRHHNPWVDFTNLPPTVNLRFVDFPTNFNALPTVAFVVPNKDNDMHDGSIQRGDSWLRDNLDAYVQWAQTNNSLLIVTWDEADKNGPNHIVTVFAGPMVQAGNYCGEINHYNVLRTIEEMYGLPLLGESATAVPILNVWRGINSPPTVALTNLIDGEIFTAPVSIPLDAQAMASVGSISKVEFFSGNTKLGESLQKPFSLVLSNAPIGTYCLNVKATDDRGETASSSPVQISVLTPEARLAQTQGDYAALFLSDDFPVVESSGFLSLKMKANGKFSAKISVAGKNYSFSGQFDLDGNSTNVISRRGLNPLTATLHLDLANDANALSGEITDGIWTSQLSGSRAFFNSKSNPAPQSGNYTVRFPTGTNSAALPMGDGFGAVTVSTSGKVALKGNLADGSKISQTTFISKTGMWPVYVSLYKGSGSLLGWIQFTNVPTTDLNGALTWTKPANVSPKMFPLGFTNEIAASGSSFIRPTKNVRVLNFTNGILAFAGGNLAQPFSIDVVLGTNNKLTAPAGDKISWSVSSRTGLFSGKATEPNSGTRISYKGAVFQKMNFGSGFFLGTTESGQVILAPREDVP